MITADGSEDHLIRPEGLHRYEVPPSLPPALRTAAAVSIPDGITEIEADIDRQDQEQSQEEEDAVLEDLVDLETDRVLDHPLVSRQMKGLYPQGWVEGNIAYFNVENGRLCCKFPDGTSDLVMPSDFDGIDLVLV